MLAGRFETYPIKGTSLLQVSVILLHMKVFRAIVMEELLER
jgi:hypothetical protein